MFFYASNHRFSVGYFAILQTNNDTGRRDCMHVIEKIERLGESHHPWWVDVLRGALGVILVLKGIYILRNAATIL